MDQFSSQIIRNSLFYGSEEMGIALRNSAYSPNIKERMDHSAAIFDSDGNLLAQAEHIPVHLGSLPWGLRNTLNYMKKESLEIEDNSMIVVNNPYIAGTHLNDVTVIRPIFFRGDLIGFSANKAHHSDIGGKVPGSISSDAKSLYEEGLILDPVFLIRRNEFNRDVFSLFSINSRNPYERRGDLKAQIAANLTGEKRVKEIIEKYGVEAFNEANLTAFQYAERMTLSKIKDMKKGSYDAEDYLESPEGKDIKLKVRVAVGDSEIKVNYAGTDKQVLFPLNAVLGVTISGVQFVFRSLLGEDVPVNFGTFKSIKIEAEEGTVLNPVFPAPVSGGNVETSQRNADVLYLAMSKAMPDTVPAAAGGSMNNIMMGGLYKNKTWAFYETIGVGLGGRKGMDGVDGVHSNMTNTMNTPIEEIEKNLPLLVTRYEFRTNSGGEGEYRGGCGIIRAYKVREGSVTVTVLSERGIHRPWGLFGGLPGKPTEVKTVNGGKTKKRGTKGTFELNENDIFEIRTAGGGGYGEPSKRSSSALKSDKNNGFTFRPRNKNK
ncbi:MAG: hydantoinase B/oxoprolinase family protein [Candidatus Thermoplasmatota archaeon]|jgi:N-methylhydantoinase B|nr:hydantoinase B/oxoprolinase family protein [Candidatus Thermoplasmatota archaeon]